MRQAVVIAGFLLLGTAYALAEPYEVAYEGDVFPEEVGWERFTSGGGAERSVAGGLLALSSDDPLVADQYRFDAQGALDAGPGEFFYAEWRMRLLPGSGIADVNVSIYRDAGQGDIWLGFSTDFVISFLDDNRIDPIDTTIWRDYRIVSFDMVNYDFFIDGAYADSGFFAFPGLADAKVWFGDCCIGQASSSEWDYFRFGAATAGDVNTDGRVNLADFATFAICFGAPVGSPATSCSDVEAHTSDLNGDEIIDLGDFAIFAQNFGA